MALKTKMINSFKQSLKNKLAKPKTCAYCDLEFLSKDEYLCHASIHPTEIISNLFIGNMSNVKNVKLINQIGITHILCIIEKNKDDIDDIDDIMNNITNYKMIINIQDNTNIVKYFSDSFMFIDSALNTNNNYKILIVCKFGMSLSPSFVIGYLMSRYNLSLITSYNIIKTKRNITNNQDYMFQKLQLFEKNINRGKKTNVNNLNRYDNKIKKWQLSNTNKINIASRNNKKHNDDENTFISKRIITMKSSSSIYEEKLLGNNSINDNYNCVTSTRKHLQRSYSSGYLPLNSHIVFTNI